MPEALKAAFVKGAKAQLKANSEAKLQGVRMVQPVQVRAELRVTVRAHSPPPRDGMLASVCPMPAPSAASTPMACPQPPLVPVPSVCVCCRQGQGRLVSFKGHLLPQPTCPAPTATTSSLRAPVMRDPVTRLGPHRRPSPSQHQAPAANTSSRMNPGPLPFPLPNSRVPPLSASLPSPQISHLVHPASHNHTHPMLLQRGLEG